MNNDILNMIVCEDDTIVYTTDNKEYHEFRPAMLSVRVDLDGGDGEFVDVATLTALYRQYVLRDGKTTATHYNYAIVKLYEQTDMKQHRRRYKWLAEKTKMFESDISAIIRCNRRLGYNRYLVLKAALESYLQEGKSA